MVRLFKGLAFTLSAALIFAAGTASAQFYKGKRLTVIINYGAGGPTDVEGRLLAKHLAWNIPGQPTVVVKNRPGAGGIVGSNFMAEVAKPDGMTIAIFTPPTMSQLLGDPGLRADFSSFEWLAGVGQPQVCYLRKDAGGGIKGPTDLGSIKGFKAAGMRNTSSHDLRLRLALDLLGADYKYVTGYRGLSKVAAGVLQNETQFSCGSVPNFRGRVEPTMVKPGIATTTYYYAPVDGSGKDVKFADLAGIPTFQEFYTKVRGGTPSGIKWDALKVVNNLSTYMLRGSFAPKGTPAAALADLRAAWNKLPNDAAFVAEYSKAFKAPPKIVTAAVAKAHIDSIKSTDPKIVAFLKGFAGAGKKKK
jgi:tripartite-type tricarboxylate transporter receptor subunit TctC